MRMIKKNRMSMRMIKKNRMSLRMIKQTFSGCERVPPAPLSSCPPCWTVILIEHNHYVDHDNTRVVKVKKYLEKCDHHDKEHDRKLSYSKGLNVACKSAMKYYMDGDIRSLVVEVQRVRGAQTWDWVKLELVGKKSQVFPKIWFEGSPYRSGWEANWVIWSWPGHVCNQATLFWVNEFVWSHIAWWSWTAGNADVRF